MRLKQKEKAFTIVELLIAVVIIAVLAAITAIAFGRINERAREALVKDSLNKASKQLEVDKLTRGTYAPQLTDAGADNINGVDNQYSLSEDGYCLTATKGSTSMYRSHNQSAVSGVCTGHSGGGGQSDEIVDGSIIQTIDGDNCPTDRTMAVDARDNNTYWVQKLGDGKCWMLTNLAYAGGGTNTHGDVKTLTTTTSNSYTVPAFYVPPGANPTTNPTPPSTSTDGIGQYGYLYNWCGAMGGQSTAACANATTPEPNPGITICPAGWRLPTGGDGGDFQLLNDAVNNGATNTTAGIRSVWLASRSGSWNNSNFYYVGQNGYYRTSTIRSTTNSYRLAFANGVNPTDHSDKYSGFAVRCLTS